jgi:hypothetical protein
VAALATEAPARPPLFDHIAADRLIWIPDPGVGYLPVRAGIAPYDQAYFEKYVGYARTQMGRDLTAARMALVARHWHGPVLDIGIGSGQFVETRPDTYGYDVNHAGIDWLNERGLWANPWIESTNAACFWDVLEHIPDFDRLLERIDQRVFCCLPIFSGPGHIFASRHYRPDEHCWYFSMRGFVLTMNTLGWTMLETCLDEVELGREGIMSFAFARR